MNDRRCDALELFKKVERRMVVALCFAGERWKHPEEETVTPDPDAYYEGDLKMVISISF